MPAASKSWPSMNTEFRRRADAVAGVGWYAFIYGRYATAALMAAANLGYRLLALCTKNAENRH